MQVFEANEREFRGNVAENSEAERSLQRIPHVREGGPATAPVGRDDSNAAAPERANDDPRSMEERQGRVSRSPSVIVMREEDGLTEAQAKVKRRIEAGDIFVACVLVRDEINLSRLAGDHGNNVEVLFRRLRDILPLRPDDACGILSGYPFLDETRRQAAERICVIQLALRLTFRWLRLYRRKANVNVCKRT